MTAVAAVLATTAVLLWRPPGAWVTRVRLGQVRPGWRPPRGLPALVVVVAVVGGVGAVGASVPQVLLGATAAGVAVFALRQWRSERRRRRLRESRLRSAEAIGLLAAELRAGLLPQRALSGLAPDFDFLVPGARAAELGGDVPSALRQAADRSGTPLLEDLAGAWLVAERAGAPLAQVLDRLEATAREDLEIEREVESGLAPARATGRLMAVLPVFGLALGSGMGGDPVGVLVGTVPGALCLVAGCALACLGTAWVERIAASAERAA